MILLFVAIIMLIGELTGNEVSFGVWVFLSIVWMSENGIKINKKGGV